MFCGIIIRMYIDDDAIKTPHFRASYRGYNAAFDLEGNIIDGDMPAKQQAYITAWALLHEEELPANWTLATKKEELFKITPLR